MAIKKIKVSDLPDAQSFEGLYTLGLKVTDSVDEFGKPIEVKESAKVGLEFVKTAADNATEAALAATSAKTAADNATEAALAAADATQGAINTATQAAATAAEAAETASQNGTYAQQQAVAAAAAAETIDAKITGKLDTPTAEAADAASIANIVGQSAAGDSVKVSSAQLAQMGAVGPQGPIGPAGPQGPKGDAGVSSSIDYSLLTEQIVPGEFWLGEDGTKKQVYTRTFVGITSRSVLNPSSLDVMILDPTTTSVQYVRGTIGGWCLPYTFISSGGVQFNNNFYWFYESDPEIGLRIIGAYAPISNPVSGSIANSLGGQPYNLTFKYTK